MIVHAITTLTMISRSRDDWPLFKPAGLCDFVAMRRRFYLRIIFAAFVTMGLLVAPFAAPAMAKVVPSAMQMSGDMPCCPNGDGHQPPQNDGGCKDCLSMGICSLNNFQALPATGLRADFGSMPSDRIFAANDHIAPDLAASPPARPPRS